jgi:hypothetical protein
MAVGFTGCGGSSLQGTWLASDGSETVVVTSDKISVDTGGTTMDFTYKVDGDNLVITMEGLGSMEVPYKLDGDSLTLSMEGGDSMTYSRQ